MVQSGAYFTSKKKHSVLHIEKSAFSDNFMTVQNREFQEHYYTLHSTKSKFIEKLLNPVHFAMPIANLYVLSPVLMSQIYGKLGIQFNSIQYRHLHTPTYILSRWRAQRTKNNKMSVSQVRISRKKVSFQFSFKTVQRKIRVTQMHWE